MNQIFFESIQKIIVVLIVFLIVVAISRRNLLSLINTFSLQSFLIALLSFIVFFQEYVLVVLLVSILTFVSRCILIPHFLKKTQKSMNIHVDLEYNLFKPTSSVFASLVIIILLFFVLLPVKQFLFLSSLNYLGTVVGTSLIFIGMLITIGRKKIITKTIGYLMMENGVVMLSVFIGEMPLLVDVFILMDLVIVLVISSVLGFGMGSSIENFHAKLNPFRNWFKKVTKE